MKNIEDLTFDDIIFIFDTIIETTLPGYYNENYKTMWL